MFSLRLAQNKEHIHINHYYTHSIHECNDMLLSKDFSMITGTE
nr:MAG TPA: hypothetical protein [Caudoviricetes sp.]